MGEVVISFAGRRPGSVGIGAAIRRTLIGGFAAVLACGIAAAGGAHAATTSERSSSILIFPKVVYDGSRDTLIQISNTSNSMVHAHCFYVNAAPICLGAGDCLAGTCTGLCEPQWVEVDFSIYLTKQQPTHWSVGDGRLVSFGAECTVSNSDCYLAGLPIGRVPPASTLPFAGELRCIEVDPSGAPLSGNHLKGEATIVSTDGDASRYNAVGLIGEPFTNNGDDILCIGGGVSDECPSGAEYQGCGERLFIPQFSEGADNPMFGPSSEVGTEITLVPCRADYEHQDPTRLVVQLLAFNEYEQRFSASTPLDCWLNIFFADVRNIFTVLAAQTRFLHTQLRSSELADSGITGVYEEYHRFDGSTSRAAFNLHEDGTRQKTDLIFLPEGL